MDLKDKIIGMALAALIALVGWNLHETWSMKEQVLLNKNLNNLKRNK